MNILEALEVALPELPEKAARRSYPRLDPRVIAKEHMEQGVPTILAKLPGSDNFARFTPEQWKLLQLFNGERSYEQVAEAIVETTGIAFTVDDVKEFAAYLLEESDLFYRTPLEKNITLKQKLGAERQKRKRFGVKDITDISLHRWPHADDYLTTLQPYFEFIYTPWFVLLTLVSFAVMGWMWADKFGEIWSDSFAFYNFASKSAWDLVEFWLLFGALAFIHESAHGMTCKHFGARVEKMEFLLMYFTPTFVCDVTQVWILGGRKARLATVIAGIWIDLVVCAIATALWWSTATGMWIHDFSYKVIMLSGIGVTLLNLNPLIKLDGYYMFSEITGEVDLKERATAYISGWVRKHIFHLPAEVEYVPRKRRVFYLTYGFASGLYGYSLIAFVVIVAYHVLRSFSTEWAWAPTILIGYLMFKSRIHTLERFMKLLYLDKKENLKAWFTRGRLAAIGAAALILVLVPWWPDFVDARFVLEPARRAVIRAEVPGVIAQTLVTEGQAVSENTALIILRNLQLESAAAKATANLQVATARSTRASLQYSEFGAAEREREQARQQQQSLAQQVARLQVNSPMEGVVVTPRISDLTGRYVEAGTELVEVADTSRLIARVYIPEFAMREVRVGARVRLHPESEFSTISGTLSSVATVSSENDPALVEKAQLSGLVPPQFYVGSVGAKNEGRLRTGMTGTAKIFVTRRSLVEFAWRFGNDLVSRRLW